MLLAAQVLVRREIGDFFVTGKGVVGADRIGQHEHVPVALMFEVVIDALLFHEPADEVKIRFPVLDAIGPGAVSTAQRLFEVRKPVVPEHLLDDVRNGHLLENPAVGRTGQEPQPGTHGHAVGVEIVNIALLAEAAHEPVEIARFILGQFEPNGDILTEKFFEGDIRVHAEQVEFKLKQASQFLRGGHAVKQEDIVAQGGDDLYGAF